MKSLLEKAKKLLKKGDILESLKIVKSISDDMSKLIRPCPNCNVNTVALIKNDVLISECPKCKAIWGNDVKKNDNEIKELNMNKKEIIEKLWGMYKSGDTDVTPYDINNYEYSGILKKSIVDKLTKEQGEALMLSEHKGPDPDEADKHKAFGDLVGHKRGFQLMHLHDEHKYNRKSFLQAAKQNGFKDHEIDAYLKLQKSDFDEFAEDRANDEHIKEMQGMIDKGHVWHLEGAMGRHAMDLIDAGHVILGPKAVKDFWGNRVPAHHEVKPGTKGSPEYAYEKTGYVHHDHEVSKDGKIGPKKDIKKAMDVKCEYCGKKKEGGKYDFVIGASKEPDWVMHEGTGKIACPDCHSKGEAEGAAAIDAHIESYNRKVTKSEDPKKAGFRGWKSPEGKEYPVPHPMSLSAFIVSHPDSPLKGEFDKLPDDDDDKVTNFYADAPGRMQQMGWSLHSEGDPNYMTAHGSKVKKSEDEFVELSKNQMINMLIDMLKKGEEPQLVSANVITKLDVTNELDMSVEKMLYEKAGLEYEALRKAKGKEWVSRKIRYLMDNEGKTQKQAVGQALGMARQKGLIKTNELIDEDLLEKAKAEPFEWKEEHKNQYGPGKAAYPFSVVNSTKIKGWKHVQDHFVDSSGMGAEGEAALTHGQFHAKLKPGMGYAITGQGQFQVHVGEFEREKKIKKSDEDLSKAADPKIHDYKGYKYTVHDSDGQIHVKPHNFKTVPPIGSRSPERIHGYFKQYIDTMHDHKADPIMKTDLSKVEITGEAPPEAGGPLRRPRSIHNTPFAIKKPIEKPIEKKPEEKKPITPAVKPGINLHMPSDADIHLHLTPDKEKSAIKSPISDKGAIDKDKNSGLKDKVTSIMDKKPSQDPSVVKSDDKGPVCKGCGMLLKGDTKHVCKSEKK